MAKGEGGGAHFAESGGYGGQYNSASQGMFNREAGPGVTQSGSTSDYGMREAAYNNLGRNASTMSPAANQAMAMMGYTMDGSGNWKAGSTVTNNANAIAKGNVDPSAVKSKTLVKDPKTGKLVNVTNWTPEQYAQWVADMYDIASGPIIQPPQDNLPSTIVGPPERVPLKDYYDRIPSGGLNSWGGTIGNMPPQHPAPPAGGGADISMESFGNIRGLALGGVTMPGETAIVGERGPELMRAPMGASVQPLVNPGPIGPGGQPVGSAPPPFRVGSPNLALAHDRMRMQALMDSMRQNPRMQQGVVNGMGRHSDGAQRLLRAMRQQRMRANG